MPVLHQFPTREGGSPCCSSKNVSPPGTGPLGLCVLYHALPPCIQGAPPTRQGSLCAWQGSSPRHQSLMGEAGVLGLGAASSGTTQMTAGTGPAGPQAIQSVGGWGLLTQQAVQSGLCQGRLLMLPAAPTPGLGLKSERGADHPAAGQAALGLALDI